MHLHVLCRGPIEASDTTLVRVTNKPKIKHPFGWMQVTSPSQALGTARRLRFDTMRASETIRLRAAANSCARRTLRDEGGPMPTTAPMDELSAITDRS